MSSPMPGVGITSGATQLTRIIRGPSSSARLCVRFDAARPSSRCRPRSPGAGPVRLDRRDVHDRAARRRHERHDAADEVRDAGEVLADRARPGPCRSRRGTPAGSRRRRCSPATSTRPSALGDRRRARPRTCVAVAHVEQARDRAPARAPRSRRRTSPRFASSRSQIATSAPKRASATAVARPMPTAAPVTIATRAVESDGVGSERHGAAARWTDATVNARPAFDPTGGGRHGVLGRRQARARHRARRRASARRSPMGFAEAGATVGICARREDRLAEVLARVQEHSPESRMWTVDLADLDGIEAFAAEVERRARRHRRAREQRRASRSAATSRRSTPTTVEAVMAINYFSPVRLTLALLPELIERSGPHREHLVGRGPARPAGRGRVHRVEGRAHRVRRSRCRSTSASPGTDVQSPRREPGRDRHRPVPPARQRRVARRHRGAARRGDGRAGARSSSTPGRSRSTSPGWFADVVGGKFPDTGAFLAGSIAWVKQKQPRQPAYPLTRFGVD